MSGQSLSQVGRMSTALRLPGSVRRPAEALLEQQMWCWGCDVRRSEGNLLIQYGFVKRVSPKFCDPSAYSFYLRPDRALTLWGWGLWIADAKHGSMFVSRSLFCTRYHPEAELLPQVWRSQDLPPSVKPHGKKQSQGAMQLLVDLLRWIADYERWLATQVSPSYRQHSVNAWPQRRRHKGGTLASEMASVWNCLSDRLSKETVFP